MNTNNISRNLLIPCSGPGTRSIGYTKFHKTLIRVGDQAVIDHIIASYTDIDTIYVMLGYNGNYVREYIEHVGYKNVKFIEIDNWNEGQIPSFKQLPAYVFDNPIYYNACDNWSNHIPIVNENTFFTCNPVNPKYYDTDNSLVYSGISFMKDSKDYYEVLQQSNHNRNDLLLMKELNNLEHRSLETWYDVGNKESYNETRQHFNSSFSVLDKKHQEVYSIKSRIVKLFDNKPHINFDNDAFPHPAPVMQSNAGLSYQRVDGEVNPTGDNFDRLYDNLHHLWQYCLNNNVPVFNKALWQDKTWERFEMMCNLDEQYSGIITINGVDIDCTGIFEHIDWDLLNNGIKGPCHGDLTLDNIIIDDDVIHYIDHRAGTVNDIFYDICKFYQSLFLNCNSLKTYSNKNNNVKLILDNDSIRRIEKFRSSEIYKSNKQKIELGVGCLWLCMAPLNVDSDLNHLLFLWAIQHLATNGDYND